MCAKCIVLDHESRENFLILLQQHSDLFRPANEVEVGMIEEMCAAYWRQRRAWSIETNLLEKQIALQPDGSGPERLAAAFDRLAAAPTLPLLHRYETRQHLMYQRAMRTLIVLRTVKYPNDPNPISEQPAPVIPMPAPSAAAPCRPEAKPAQPEATPTEPAPTGPQPTQPGQNLTPAGPEAAPTEPAPAPTEPPSAPNKPPAHANQAQPHEIPQPIERPLSDRSGAPRADEHDCENRLQ